MAPRIGILALQGAFAAHREALSELGAECRLVRLPEHLSGLDGLVIPGGESTTMSNLVQSSGLTDPLRTALDEGLPVFGTCAGMILLASRIEDGRDDQIHLDAMSLSVRRNAYGRQVDSFETDLDIDGLDGEFHAVFIRAPLVTSMGPEVRVLATHGDHAVLVAEGNRMACSFHPELTADRRVHRLFLDHLSASIPLTR
ncbi:MAG: Glutamine amidotransferase subunit PdxT [Actinomycetota bacterium]